MERIGLKKIEKERDRERFTERQRNARRTNGQTDSDHSASKRGFFLDPFRSIHSSVL